MANDGNKFKRFVGFVLLVVVLGGVGYGAVRGYTTLLQTSLRILKKPLVGLPKDSPVEIAGGSFHLCAPSNTFSRGGQDWDIPVSKGDLLDITPYQIVNDPKALKIADGEWTIDISAGKINTGTPQALVLTGHTNPESQLSTIHVHVDDPHSTVSKDTKSIILPYEGIRCKFSEGFCSHPNQIIIKSKTQNVTWKCGSNGDWKCGVYIGVVTDPDRTHPHYDCENSPQLP